MAIDENVTHGVEGSPPSPVPGAVGWRRWELGFLFVVSTLALLPPVVTVRDRSLLQIHDGDEPFFIRDCLDVYPGWWPFGAVRNGLDFGYGAPWWAAVGVPAAVIAERASDEWAVVWARLVSVMGLTATLALVCGSARTAGVAALPRWGLLFLVATMPALVTNATRIHPETPLLAAMTLVPVCLMRDRCRMGRWWWLGCAAYGFAVGVKVSAYPLGAAVFAYWAYATAVRGDWGRGLLRAVGAAVLAPAVFAVANFPLAFGDNLSGFRWWLEQSLLSNATNNLTSTEGLGWRVWVEACDKYYIKLEYLCVVLAAAALAAAREVSARAERPFALVGLVGWGTAFASTALTIKKELWWNHYLIPAFASFPFLVIGVLVWLREWLESDRRGSGPVLLAGLLGLALGIPALATLPFRALGAVVWLRLIWLRLGPRSDYRGAGLVLLAGLLNFALGLPAVAALPCLVIGFLLCVRGYGTRSFVRIALAVVLVLLAAPRVRDSVAQYCTLATFEYSPVYTCAEHNLSVAREVLAAQPPETDLVIFRDWLAPAPMRVGGRPTTIVRPSFVDFGGSMARHRPHLIIFTELHDSNPLFDGPDNVHRSRPNYQQILQSRALFLNSLNGPVEFGGFRFRLERVPQARGGTAIYVVHHLN